MAIILQSAVIGTYKGKSVDFFIRYPNVSPHDAAKAAYLHLTGKDLDKRRKEWTSYSVQNGTIHLNCCDSDEIEMQLSIQKGIRAKPAIEHEHLIPFYTPESQETAKAITETARATIRDMAATGGIPPVIEPMAVSSPLPVNYEEFSKALTKAVVQSVYGISKEPAGKPSLEEMARSGNVAPLPAIPHNVNNAWRMVHDAIQALRQAHMENGASEERAIQLCKEEIEIEAREFGIEFDD